MVCRFGTRRAADDTRRVLRCSVGGVPPVGLPRRVAYISDDGAPPAGLPRRVAYISDGGGAKCAQRVCGHTYCTPHMAVGLAAVVFAVLVLDEIKGLEPASGHN